LADEAARRIKGQAHLEILAAHRADAGQLVSCLNRIPANEREGRIAFAAARELQILGDHREAQAIVEAALERGSEAWNDDLVELYGQLPGPDLTGRIARAEQWLVTRPGDAVLLLALGRMCERQRLWGKAQSYFEASLAVDDSRDAHLELARLMERLERDDEANRHYRLSVGEKTSE
jgi:HemY protein